MQPFEKDQFVMTDAIELTEGVRQPHAILARVVNVEVDSRLVREERIDPDLIVQNTNHHERKIK